MSLSNAERQRRYRVRKSILTRYPDAEQIDVIAVKLGSHVGLFDPDTGEQISAVKLS